MYQITGFPAWLMFTLYNTKDVPPPLQLEGLLPLMKIKIKSSGAQYG